MSLEFIRIVVDENIAKEVVDSLKGLGFKEVYWILEKRPGITDPEVWRLAASKEAILVTGDVGVIAQLEEGDVLYGPLLVEYSTAGFTKNELQDPVLMKTFVTWLFENGHHEGCEHIVIRVEGTVSTRLQTWQREKYRRKRSQ